jgi:hypothetical protein
MTASPRVRAVEAVVVVLVIAVVVGQLLATTPPVAPSISVNQSVEVAPGATIRALTTIASNFPAHLMLSGLGFAHGQGPTTIDYYYDSGYPVQNSTMANWYGLPQHLEALASARHLPLTIQRIDAAGLAQLLIEPPASSTILVLASGVLPSNVDTPTHDALLSWIRAGGTAFWAGALPGEFRGNPIDPTGPPDQAQEVPHGSEGFLNASWLMPGPNVLSTPGEDALALGVSYPFALPDALLNVSAIDGIGGEALGYVEGGGTNLARIPLGNGTLIDLDAPVLNLARLAPTLLNLLESGAVQGSFDLLGSLPVTVAAGATVSEVQNWPIPANLLVDSHATVCAFAYETDYLAPLASTTCLAIVGGGSAIQTMMA